MLLVFFSDKGKLGALELMQRKCHYQYNFSVFGQPWELSSGFFQKLQEFTCHLFVPKSATTDAIINPSLPKGMKSTPASFPHAKIAYSSMNCMQTIKQEFGDDSCNVNPLCWIQQVMAGQLMPKGIWTFSGLPESSSPKTVLKLMNYRCVMSVPAKMMNAYALVMDSNAQRYASSKPYQLND